MDSSNAIAWASGRKNPPGRLLHIVRDIVVHFTHVRRMANCVADFLTKAGVES